MAIRIRHVHGFGLVALCAARSMPKEGDLYLDDAVHHALSAKFTQDHISEGFMAAGFDYSEWPVMEQEESNNPNRELWDRTYLPEAGSDARDVQGCQPEQADSAIGNDAGANQSFVKSAESTASPARGTP